MKGNPVTIVKDGALVNIDVDRLCLGDTVVLQAGDIVPADLKLIEARGLDVDEFDIMGEILPVTKNVGEGECLLYLGSRVVRGEGKGIVIAIGDQSEFGSVLKLEREHTRPLAFPVFQQKALGLVGLLLPAWIVLLARSINPGGAIFIFLFFSILLVLLQNDSLFESFLLKADLNQARKKNIVVRDPKVLMRLNEIDTLCFDKTGVLTTRDIAVKKLVFQDKILDARTLLSDSDPLSIVKTGCALCNDILFYEKLDRANPIDKAMVSFAEYNGVNIPNALSQHQRIFDQPFDSEKRYMACGFEASDGEAIFFAKGDPEVILRMCNRFTTSSGIRKKMDSNFWSTILAQMAAIYQDGATAIALAYQNGAKGEPPTKFTFLCLVQLENPLRPDAQKTIRWLKEKGKRSILLTGDIAASAQKVAEACGITSSSKACLTGKMIEKMDLQEVSRQSGYCSVFARLIPSQKGILIRLFQQQGRHVAMVGDGPNDGIALKAADVGISFVENSSEIAQRLARILIHDITDLILLFNASDRLHQKTQIIRRIRLILIAILLLSSYSWAFLLRW